MGAKDRHQGASFTEFLQRYGAKNTPIMLSRDARDVARWQLKFKQKLDELRGEVPKRVDCGVEVLESTKTDTHIRHLLKIPVNEFADLQAYLLVPTDIKEGEKRPALLALHGHAIHGMETVAGMDNPEAREFPSRQYGKKAAEAGFVVMIPAWWGWPGRDAHVEMVGPQRDKCNVIQMAAQMYGLNLLSLHIQDARAAVDALIQRSEVDPNRIGCIGNSYGGRMTMWAGAYDERIVASVASGCMNTFRERSLKLESCGIQYFPGLLRYGDVADVFALIAPRPLQLMAGEHDHLLNASDVKEMYETVSRIYKSLGASENLDYALHPGGHEFVWEL
ncbi:MAG: alpha/beta hydrolase family protein, partial [Planctomycetota bacterium]